MMNSQTLAVAYHRISDDREGREAGVTRQQEDTAALAKQHGVVVVESLTDNDISASTRSRKVRPAYNRMIELVENGSAGVILAYSNSRLTRRPMEMENLIQLHERTGVVIRTKVSGDDDLSTADGRMMARLKASIDAAEAERTGERVARHHQSQREAGVPRGGNRPFGWVDDKIELHPAEAAFMQSLIADIIAGMSIRSAVAKLAEADYRTTSGNAWTPQTLTQYLRNGRLVGYRTYKKQIFHDEEGRPIEGLWQPMLDLDTWDRLQLTLAANHGNSGSVKGRKNKRKHLLTGLLRCGLCNAAMYGNAGSRTGVRYMCGGPHSNSIAGDRLENMVHTMVVEKLERDSVAATLAPSQWGGAARFLELETTITATLNQLGKPGIRPERIFGQVQRLEGELAVLREERDEWLVATSGPVIARTTPQQYLAHNVVMQRPVIEKYLSAIYVRPQIKQQKRFDPDRVVPAWREDG